MKLSNERIQQILHQETPQKEEVKTILRAVYIRYMNLFENYIANLDSLDNDKIDEFRKYHEETQSLIKYYYMDIPQDICTDLEKFEEETGSALLGREWKKVLYDAYDEFKERSNEWDMSEDYYKAAFKKHALKEFYAAMSEIFRSGFGTESQTAKDIMGGISGLLFGKKEK